MTAAVLARYGGLRAEQLQARMLAGGDGADPAEVEQFCERARELFGLIALPGMVQGQNEGGVMMDRARSSRRPVLRSRCGIVP